MICFAIFVFVVILGFGPDLLMHKLPQVVESVQYYPRKLSNLPDLFFLGQILNCELVCLCER
jgi:hypothetical protein